MRKLVILGLILMLTLSGCTVDLLDNFNIGSIENKYRFKDYDEFAEVKDELEDDKDYFVIDTYESMKVKDVDAIDVETIFEDVVVVREKRDDVKIHYFGVFSKESKNKEPEYEISTKSTFKYHVNWKKLKGPSHAMMVIYLPKEYDGDLKIDVVSGDVEGDELILTDVEINTVSGDITIGHLEAETLKLDCVSGAIDLEEAVLEEIQSETVSGDVLINNLETEELNLETVSGDIEVTLEEQKGDIQMDTTSGSIVMTVKKSVNATIDIKSVSGDIEVAYDLKNVEVLKSNRLNAEVGKGKFEVDIETVSGDVTLK